jgi:hypothetical protein
MWRRDWNLVILPPGAAGSFCSPTVYLKYEEILYSTVLDRVRSTYYVLSTIYYGWFHWDAISRTYPDVSQVFQ